MRPDLRNELGISSRMLWTVAGVMWAAMGTMQLLNFSFGLAPLPLPVESALIGGVTPLIGAAVWFTFAHRNVQGRQLFHFPIALGLLLICVATYLDPNDHSADVVYPMVPMIAALVLVPLRMAWPYVIGAVVGSSSFVVTSHDVTPWARVAIVSILVLSIAGLLAQAQGELRRALARNRELSETDALTGIANVRRMKARLADELNGRKPAALTLLSLDLDAFKSVNDTLGHSTGDRVLVEVARAIERQIQPGDLVARRGGDEFTVIALDHDDRSAEDLAQRIADDIIATRIDLCPSIEPGVSIGITKHVPGESVQGLLRRADDALHDRKSASHAVRGAVRVIGAESLAEEVVDELPGEPLTQSRKVAPTMSWSESHAIQSAHLIAGVFAVFAAVAPLLSIAMPSSQIASPFVLAVCAISAVLAAVCLLAKRHSTVTAQIGMLALVMAVGTALVHEAGVLRGAMVGLLVIPSLLGFYVAGRARGAVIAIAGMSIYGYFVTTIPNYELDVLRILQNSLVVVMVGYLVPKAAAQARATFEENERLSGVDPLTGLANVRRMNQRLVDDLARSMAGSTDDYVTVFMIDLDDFKQVNDQFSHAKGDKMLVAVGEAIRDQARRGDLVARRGGDEFVLIVTHDGEVDLPALAERIERGIVERRLVICPALNPAASVGWVTSRPGDKASELLARADSSEQSVKQRRRLGRPNLRSVA